MSDDGSSTRGPAATDFTALLESLIARLAQGEAASEQFEELHQAAVREERVRELGEVYEHATREHRLRRLEREEQTALLLHAAHFFGDVAGDTHTALVCVERALLVAPSETEPLNVADRLLLAAADGARALELYRLAAARQPSVSDQLALWQRCSALLDTIPGADEQALAAKMRIAKLDPNDARTRNDLARDYEAQGRFLELSKLLEDSLKQEPAAEDAADLRLRLVALYRDVLRVPQRALPHLEQLLAADPVSESTLQAAESLVESRLVAQRLSPVLADAYARLGRPHDELSVLIRELKISRPPRLAAAQRRVALLRLELFDDVQGALELLGPLVASEPGDDQARRRYLEISARENRSLEAARLLSRALQRTKSEAVRARVGHDLGSLYLGLGDSAAAQAAFEQVVKTGGKEDAVLASARRLVELLGTTGDPKKLARALHVVARLEPDEARRHEAAKRLAELSESYKLGSDYAFAAWRALVDSSHAEEALQKLTELCEKRGDKALLGDVLDLRAKRSGDPAQARAFAFRSAELKAEATDLPGALEGWRRFVHRYGPSRDVSAKMAVLLEQSGQWEELAAIREDEARLASSEEQPGLFAELGRLRLERLGDPAGALQAFRRSVELDPAEPTSRAGLEGLLASGPAQSAAADVLEPIYRSERAHERLVSLLEIRAALESDVGARLTCLTQAAEVVESELGDHLRGIELCRRALDAAGSADPALLRGWLERLERFAKAGGHSERMAEVLLAVFGESDRLEPELAEFALVAADALAAAGNTARARALVERALADDPTSPELLARLDAISIEDGRTPLERIERYRQSLELEPTPERWLALMHAIAEIERQAQLSTEAIATLREIIRRHPDNWSAHLQLVEALEQIGDEPALDTELERGLGVFRGAERQLTLVRMIERLAKGSDEQRAVELSQALLEESELEDAALETVERIFEHAGEVESLQQVLERRARTAREPAKRAEALERWGTFLLEQLGDSAAAAEAWRIGARLCQELPGELERECRLCERLLDAFPGDQEAAARLVELYATADNWAKVPEVYALCVRLEEDDAKRVDLLLTLAPRATQAKATDEFIALADEALWRLGGGASGLGRKLIAAKASVLAADPSRQSEAGQTFRTLVESYGEEADVAAYLELIERTQDASEQREGLRWVYSWRASRATDPLPILFEWAELEEQRLSDPGAAAAIYERIAGEAPQNRTALEGLVRLYREQEPAKALGALDRLLEISTTEEKSDLYMRSAELLLDRLARPAEALERVAQALRTSGVTDKLLELSRRLLSDPAASAQAADLFERLASTSAPPEGLRILRFLLEATVDAPEHAAARGRWYERVLARVSGDAREVFSVTLRAATELPMLGGFWSKSEELGRELGELDAVGAAYHGVLARALEPEVAEAVGSRAADFFEQVLGEPSEAVAILQRVLTLAPRARWALDRVKLTLTLQRRYEELLELYDRAIDAASEPELRGELLDEAVVVARSLANEPDVAIRYLEQLSLLRPSDARLETTLERLYERQGQTRKLIELLQRKLPELGVAERTELSLRIASLWMELHAPEHALTLIEPLLEQSDQTVAACELLERALKSPSLSDGEPLEPSRDAQRRAAWLLQQQYARLGRPVDVVRVAELELELLDDPEEKASRLAQIVSLRLDELADERGALDALCALIRLKPESRTHRVSAIALANRLSAEERLAEVFILAAEEVQPPRDELLINAAELYADNLGDRQRAAELYLSVFGRVDADPATARQAGIALERLLAAEGRATERCTVLERLATLAESLEESRALLCEAGSVALDELRDAERSIKIWRALLDKSPDDRAGLDGLIRALRSAGRFAELARALEARARLAIDPQAARRDLVRVANLYAEELEDRDAAAAMWTSIRGEYGPDRQSFEALYRLYEAGENRDRLVELVRTEAAAELHPERRRQLYLKLAELQSSPAGNPVAAVHSYALAGDWAKARSVAESTRADPQLGKSALRTLLKMSSDAWRAGARAPDSAPAQAALWALRTLAVDLCNEGDPARALDLYLKGASFPFEPREQRKLRCEAAWVAADALRDPPRAIEILQQLFEQDADDEIAAKAESRYAGLLESAGLRDGLAALWERQARRASDQGQAEQARELWLKVAALWDSNASDVERAISALSRAASLGSEPALEALARLHRARGDRRRTAEALDGLLERAPAEARAERALAAADAYLELGDRASARTRLEQALSAGGPTQEARARLVEIYRAESAWGPLVELLGAEAREEQDAARRASLLREAGRVTADRLGNPASAALLLEQALESAPGDHALSCELAELLGAAGRHEDAARVLRQRIEAYGGRRPRERALVHRQLGELLLSAGQRHEALAELELAVQIDPTRTEVLYQLARLAEEEGDLGNAERTYQTLLLALRPSAKLEQNPTLPEVYIGLSEVARKRGDASGSEEFVELALESALGDPRQALGLERALRAIERFDLLVRVVEARLDRTSDSAAVALALAELVDLGLSSADDVRLRARIQSRAEALYAALVADSTTAPVWRALHRVFGWLGDSATAASIVEHWVFCLRESLDAESAEQLYELGEICLNIAARQHDGLLLLERALERDPQPDRALAMLRPVLDADPPDERAIRLFESLCDAPEREAMRAEALGRIASLPNASPADVRAAVSHALSGGQTALARSILENNLSRDSEPFNALDRAWMLERLSDLARNDDRIADAAELSVRAAAALQGTPEAAPLLERAATLYRDRLGEPARAFAIFARLIDQSPASGALWDAVLEIQAEADCRAELIELIERSAPRIESPELRHRLMLHQAKLLLERSATDAALAALKRIIDEDPGQSEAAELRARLLEQSGRLDELVVALESRLTAARSHADAALSLELSAKLAGLLERSSRPADALAAYREVLRQEPQNLDALRAFARLSETLDVEAAELAQTLDELLKVEQGTPAADAALRLARIRAEEWNELAAERALLRGFDADPTHPGILRQLSERYTERGQWPKLARTLERALAAMPDNTELMLALADAHRKAGQYEQALSVLETLGTAEKPEILQMRYLVFKATHRSLQAIDALLGAALLDARFIDELSAELERGASALELEPATHEAKVAALLDLVAGAGDAARTRELVRRLAQGSPPSRAALERLVRIETAQRNWPETISAYRRLLSLDLGDKLEATAIALADVCEKAGRAADARADLERALNKAPKSGRLRARLRALYETLGARDQLARTYLSEASEEADPLARIGALVNAGALMLESGNAAQALAILERAHEQQPAHIEATMLLASACQKLGMGQKALSVLCETAARHDRTRSKEAAKLHHRIAELHLEADDLIEAFDALTLAFELDKSDARIALMLGLSAVDLDEQRVAQQALQAVTATRSGDADPAGGVSADSRSLAYYHLGRLAALAHDDVKARLMAEKAVREDPKNKQARRLLEGLRTS